MASRKTAKSIEGGAARRWLRALVLEDWTLKAMALLITLGLWYAVTTQRAPATKRLHDVPLEFLLPQGVDIGNDPVDKVDVTLVGSQDKLAVLTARDLVAQVDVTGLQPGDRNPRLTDKNVSMDLPEGAPPEGFVRGAVTVEPGRVRVRGPASHVNAVERAFTETISLANQREPLTRPQVSVDIPDHKVAPVEATVSVRVEIGEEQAEQRLTNVPVQSESGGAVTPAAAAVTLRGPRSVVAALRAEDLRLVVTPGADGRSATRLTLPPGAQGRVELVNTSPSEFTVNR